MLKKDKLAIILVLVTYVVTFLLLATLYYLGSFIRSELILPVSVYFTITLYATFVYA